MNNRLFLIALVLLGCSSFTVAQSKPTKAKKENIATVLDDQLKGVEKAFVGAADAMPEDKYDFAPTNGEFKGVRTFAQQVKHVAAVNYMVFASILGEKVPVDIGGENGPEAMKSILRNFFVTHSPMVIKLRPLSTKRTRRRPSRVRLVTKPTPGLVLQR